MGTIRRAKRPLVHRLALCFLLGCGGAVAQTPQHGKEQHVTAEPLVGSVTRAQIMELATWRHAFEHAQPDLEAARALRDVPAGAEVTVYLGTWCGDSKREVTRLWKALDTLGAAPPFTVRYVGVDRQKHAPEVDVALELKRVPTFVVSRQRHEVGRVIEHAPRGIETELAELLVRP